MTNIWKCCGYARYFTTHDLDFYFYSCVSFVNLYLLIEQEWDSSTSLNPSALENIQKLEASKRLPLREDEEPGIFSQPIFVAHLNDVSCEGGATAHFECKVEPKNDPSLEISKS